MRLIHPSPSTLSYSIYHCWVHVNFYLYSILICSLLINFIILFFFSIWLCIWKGQFTSTFALVSASLPLPFVLSLAFAHAARAQMWICYIIFIRPRPLQSRRRFNYRFYSPCPFSWRVEAVQYETFYSSDNNERRCVSV